MSAITFDAIQYVDRLVSKGTPEPQAKEQVVILQEVLDETLKNELATKHDLPAVQNGLSTALSALKNELLVFRSELSNSMKDTETRLIKWMIASQISTIVILITVFKLFF